jgi:hypothetical protein
MKQKDVMYRKFEGKEGVTYSKFSYLPICITIRDWHR